jgi:hypothetical protein
MGNRKAMAEVFTREHFELLNRWKGERRDKSSPEQNRAFEELKHAYEVTRRWAEEVQKQYFPDGSVELRARPTTQANNFAAYNWAKIYPAEDSPTQLAYTVGISADTGFEVKIDTVGLDDGTPLRKRYEELRGDYGHSPVVAILDAEAGLSKSLPELVAWTGDVIGRFKPTYEQVCDLLQLPPNVSFPHQDAMRFENGAFGKRVDPPPPQRKGHCMDVWVVCESLRTVLDRVPERLEVRNDERLSKSNTNNVEQEFYRWRRWRNEGGNVHDEAREGSHAVPHTTSRPINCIYYGPPGTGKTRALSQLLAREYEQTTNQRSDAEWRSQFVAEKIATLKWWEAVFAALYDLGHKAKVDQILDHAFIRSVVDAKQRNQNVRNTLWRTLQDHAVEDSSTCKSTRRLAPNVFDKTPDSTWYLAGNWQEECADLIALVQEFRVGPGPQERIRRYSFVTFHQSYGYEEFVEGLRPILDTEDVAGEVRYEIRDGVFKKLCRLARLAPDQHFAMVIDEINRGNISKIFGELITLIEADKREGGEDPLAVILPFSGESFTVPSNVDVIGTMNTADRSLALLDTALRRRFEFEPFYPDDRDEPGAPLSGLRVTAGPVVVNVPKMLAAINRRIEALYDRDHCIGHGFFTPLRNESDENKRFEALVRVFRKRVLPLLEEYFFEDWQKIRLVLADNQKRLNACFVTEAGEGEDALAELFGDNHGLDAYGTKRRYVVQESAFSNPEAYVGIYQRPSP